MAAKARPLYAPFNRETGETIEGLGHDYVVHPMADWMDTPVIAMAMERAVKAYKEHTIPQQMPEILIQAYHSTDKLVVVIAMWGKAPGRATWQWHYVTTVFDITGELKVQLVLAGRWRSSTRH